MKSNKQRNAEIDRKTLVNLIRDPDLPEELKRELTDLLLADVLADFSIEELQTELELDADLLEAADRYRREQTLHQANGNGKHPDTTLNTNDEETDDP